MHCRESIFLNCAYAHQSALPFAITQARGKRRTNKGDTYFYFLFSTFFSFLQIPGQSKSALPGPSMSEEGFTRQADENKDEEELSFQPGSIVVAV